MTKDSVIAFWEFLKDRVLSSCLDGLLGCLDLSRGGLKQPLAVSVLSCCLFLIFLPVCFLTLSRSRTEDHIHTRAALQALLTVAAPTYSLWPRRYIELASALRPRVDIPFDMITEDTINGVIEFRSPVNDLADLIGSGVTVNGHTICVNVGWNWWINYFEWWLLAKGDGQPKPAPCDWLYSKVPTANSSPLGLSLSPFALTSSTSLPLHCLDRLPHGTLPPLNMGCKVMLEFTTVSPSLRVLSTAQVVSAIPFIFSGRRPRPLVSVLKQLSDSYGPNLAVDSLSNVSADYERALRHVYKSISEGQKIREMWMKTLGIKAWRRDMFLVALEASLVRRGWLERWAVQVAVK